MAVGQPSLALYQAFQRLVDLLDTPEAVAVLAPLIQREVRYRLMVSEQASVQMSTSTFHHHFRALTAMSPLQFQKKLRLHKARRLLLAEQMDASTAAFRVGYESPSQFGREYARLFGAPPLRHIASLRTTGGRHPRTALASMR